MKYVGTRGLEVTIGVDILPAAYENEELIKSGLLSLITRNGHKFNVILPENVKTMEDAKYIAFECVLGHSYTKDIAQFFTVNLKNIRHLGQEIIYCITVSELDDYNVDAMKEFIKKKEEVVVEKEVTADEC